MSCAEPPKTELEICLVVGPCGFLGRHVIQMLQKDTTCTQIVGISRAPYSPRFEGVTYHVCDITNSEQVQLVMEQYKPKTIINTASPIAYVDHEHAKDYDLVNVKGNLNLLNSAAAVGSVKVFVYTSSAPIIAGPGGDYSLENESYPTIAHAKHGDPYHIAKAKGDELVLSYNGKNGIRTCCIRPTALYGDGDKQLMIPTLDVYRQGMTMIWMGNNQAWMDVVYAGHVAKAEVLAAHGLLAVIANPDAPKVDGEAFNITDDQPWHPWDFFKVFWVAAGDSSSKLFIIKVPHTIVMAMAVTAEFWTWAVSLGRRRPEFMKKERMEFVLLTRTYNIDKIKKRLGFVPWVDQPYKSQAEAVQGTVANYIAHHPELFPDYMKWPENPFKYITETGYETKDGLRHDHYAITNARLMALTHNVVFRALNAIYHQAKEIDPGTSDATDFMSYCAVVYEFIHHHHSMEEKFYFHDIAQATGVIGHMEKEIAEHRSVDAGLEAFRRYVECTHSEQYSGDKLREILDSFAGDLTRHMHSEIDSILDLHAVIDSQKLEDIYMTFYKACGRDANAFKIAPLLLGCMDREDRIDGQEVAFPEFSIATRLAVHLFFSPLYRGLWRFSPCSMYGRSRKSGFLLDKSGLSSDSVVDKVYAKMPDLKSLLLIVLVSVFVYMSGWKPVVNVPSWYAESIGMPWNITISRS